MKQTKNRGLMSSRDIGLLTPGVTSISVSIPSSLNLLTPLSSSPVVTSKIENKGKSSSYSRDYVAACTEWRGHLRDLAPGLRSSEETLQRWRAVGDTVAMPI